MKKMTDNRPLSPHLSIHKRVLTAVFSIFHRISGIGLSVGALLISIWFFLISFGPEFYIYFQILSKSILFKLVLMIWTVGIFYHLFNGCRKLYWSFGIGMELSQVYKSGYAVICLTLISTLVVWYCMKNYAFKWLTQRITASILIPLTFWFIYSAISLSKMTYSEIEIFSILF